MKRFIYVAALFALAGCGGSSNPTAAGNVGASLPPATTTDETLAALLSPATTTPVESVENTPPVADATDASFASLLNAMRLDNSAGPVTHDVLLDQAAQDYAVVLIENDHFSHTGPDGSTLRERVDATGYQWAAIGENLGRGQQTEQQIMDGWTNSQGHHENNINPVFTEFGLGFTREGQDTRWVLVLGTPR